MAHPLMHESIWFDQWKVTDAEKFFYENQAQLHAPLVIEGSASSSLVNEIARARQHIKQSLEHDGKGLAIGVGVDTSIISHRLDSLEKENTQLRAVTKDLQSVVSKLEGRIAALELATNAAPTSTAPSSVPAADDNDDDSDDDDIDLFGSDDEEADAEAEKLKQERLQAYAEKKAKKPGPIAKSNVILDVKPWDDETDMAEVEKCVRSINMDGLLWGASKLVPVGYGIKKLQITTVVVDDLVSVEELEEKITAFEDLIQSCDIAAFNKI